jgi:dipicolinate synthase subunit B
MESVTLGFAMCGSFCTYEAVLSQLERLHEEFPNIIPIMSEVSYQTDSRFGKSKDYVERVEQICGRSIIHTIAEAEPIGPKKLLDALLVMPCTGNTIAKIAAGIADSPVTLAVKAHQRNERPVILAVSTNDGLAGNAANIGQLLCRRNLYFVPFRQDDPVHKPRSLVADFAQAADTVKAALQGRQIQPILL